jgi:hypothetical protein
MEELEKDEGKKQEYLRQVQLKARDNGRTPVQVGPALRENKSKRLVADLVTCREVDLEHSCRFHYVYAVDARQRRLPSMEC